MQFILKTESEVQLENLAAEIDKTEADALYIVGGDGTLSCALSGIFKKYDIAPLPIGVFPGGDNNRSLLSLVPEVFCKSIFLKSKFKILVYKIRCSICPIDGIKSLLLTSKTAFENFAIFAFFLITVIF